MSASQSGFRNDSGHRLYARQRQLLALLDALGGRSGNLDFQKLLFLYYQEPSVDPLYDFVPYRFGAFSFTSYADRRKLVARGLLESEEQHWQLTAEGKRTVGGVGDMHMAAFTSRHRALRGDALVAETYRRFPYYAIRSEIAQRVLRDDDAALHRIEAARPRTTGDALSTIGYEGRTLESYLNVMIQAGVTLLCDVRRNPISRKYGFSKSALANACESVGIRYEHLPQLGVASEKRRGLETQADYDALFAEYEQSTLPKQVPALAKIRDWIRSGERVALTCYERLPEQCHRHCVATAVQRQARSRIVAKHL
jgi:uncharacterized protein (DUF488 family)